MSSRRIFGLIQPTTPTLPFTDTTAHQDDTANKHQEMEKKCSQTAQSIILLLTKKNAVNSPDMSRLSYVYDMNSRDELPRQVFRTQLETSSFHKNEVRQSQDISLVIEALNKRGQGVFKKRKEEALHPLEEKPRKRVKIFTDISSSEDEKVLADDSEQLTPKTNGEGLFGFSHLMPKMNRLQDNVVSDKKNLLIVEEDLEDDFVMKRFNEDTTGEEFEGSEEDRDDKPTLSRKKMAQKAERKIDKQFKAIEKMLPKDKD